MQREVDAVFVSDALYAYITALAAWTRGQPSIRLGMSPRGTIALLRMSKSCAYLYGRAFLVPQDVQTVFENVCAHRLLLSPRARVSGVSEQQLAQLALAKVPAPAVV